MFGSWKQEIEIRSGKGCQFQPVILSCFNEVLQTKWERAVINFILLQTSDIVQTKHRLPDVVYSFHN